MEYKHHLRTQSVGHRHKGHCFANAQSQLDLGREGQGDGNGKTKNTAFFLFFLFFICFSFFLFCVRLVHVLTNGAVNWNKKNIIVVLKHSAVNIVFEILKQNGTFFFFENLVVLV